jgi:hypothetical protein
MKKDTLKARAQSAKSSAAINDMVGRWCCLRAVGPCLISSLLRETRLLPPFQWEDAARPCVSTPAGVGGCLEKTQAAAGWHEARGARAAQEGAQQLQLGFCGQLWLCRT